MKTLADVLKSARAHGRPTIFEWEFEIVDVVTQITNLADQQQHEPDTPRVISHREVLSGFLQGLDGDHNNQRSRASASRAHSAGYQMGKGYNAQIGGKYDAAGYRALTRRLRQAIGMVDKELGRINENGMGLIRSVLLGGDGKSSVDQGIYAILSEYPKFVSQITLQGGTRGIRTIDPVTQINDDPYFPKYGIDPRNIFDLHMQEGIVDLFRSSTHGVNYSWSEAERLLREESEVLAGPRYTMLRNALENVKTGELAVRSFSPVVQKLSEAPRSSHVKLRPGVLTFY